MTIICKDYNSGLWAVLRERGWCLLVLLIGYLKGGDPIQLRLTGHKDEMMSLPVSSLEDPLSITNDMRR